MRHPHYDEVMDCLDQRWAAMLVSLGYVPVPLANVPASEVPECIASLRLDGAIFTGGNSVGTDLTRETDAANINPGRDAFETALFAHCLQHNIPVLGVCRGMQHINVLLGGHLAPISGHAGQHRHALVQPARNDGRDLPESVNTFHNFCIPADGLAPSLTKQAEDSEGNIEAFSHDTNRVSAIMWHPEREPKPTPHDIRLIEATFQ